MRIITTTFRTLRRYIAARVALATVKICPAAHLPSCLSSAAAASRRRGHRPGHHDQVPAARNGRCHGKRAGHHDQLPARIREQQPGHRGQVPAANKTSGAADNGLGATAKYLQRTASGAIFFRTPRRTKKNVVGAVVRALFLLLTPRA